MGTLVRGSASWMRATWGEGCKPDRVVTPIYAGGPRFVCDRRARPAFLELGRVFVRWNYIIHTCGCYNCRHNTSDPSVLSNHSWGTALDVNEATNPYTRGKLITDMPAAMIRSVREIRTVDLVQVFRWGGDYTSVKDAMHFEIIATPAELARGFLALEGDRANGKTWAIVRRGSRGPAVIALQNLLRLERTTGDGLFGPRTEEAVRRYQSSRGLVADGIVGAATWTALLHNLPALLPGEAPPQKRVPK
jgi:hypothetical protein